MNGLAKSKGRFFHKWARYGVDSLLGSSQVRLHESGGAYRKGLMFHLFCEDQPPILQLKDPDRHGSNCH